MALGMGLGISLLFWASSFSGIRAALVDYSPVEMSALRFLVASLALAAFAVFKGVERMQLADLPVIVTTGILGITLHQVLLSAGEQTVSAGAASMIANLIPAFTALLAVLFLGERLPLQAWLGVGICMFGVTLIGYGGSGQLQFDFGVVLILGAALVRAASFILQKRLMRRYGAFGVTAYTVWAATLVLLLAAPQLPSAVRQASFASTGAVVYLGLFPAAFGYVVWGYALERTSATRAASLLFLVPVLAVGVAWVWLGETPTLMTLVGGTLSLAGVTWVRSKEPGVRLMGRRLHRVATACCEAVKKPKLILEFRGRS